MARRARNEGQTPSLARLAAPAVSRERTAAIVVGVSGIRRLRQMTRRLGQLAERDVGLLFTATTIGDRLSFIALAFAVLEFGSATDLGFVLAAGRSSFAVMLGCLALIVALPSVRAIRAAPPEVTAAPPVTAV